MNFLQIVKSRLELLFWLSALVLLYFMDPGKEHFSLCPLNALGISWCPGCGLGHSIHYYLHLDPLRGWQEHYLGIFAILVILYRIFQLASRQLTFKTKSYEH